MNRKTNINELGADKKGNDTRVGTPAKGTAENSILIPEQRVVQRMLPLLSYVNFCLLVVDMKVSRLDQ